MAREETLKLYYLGGGGDSCCKSGIYICFSIAIFKFIFGVGDCDASGGGGVKMVVVGYWWWCWGNGGGGVSDSLCMSASCFSCRSDIVMFML